MADEEFVPPYSISDANLEEGREIEEVRARSQQPFPDPDEWLTEKLEKNIFLTTADAFIGWGRHYSTWPINMGLACCAFEMIAAAVNRWDIARFGMEIMRPTPRQADLMIVSGTITWKMAPNLLRIYEQMAEPKWVLAMGSCAISGGIFYDSYSVVPGVNRLMPVDIYVPGCPPRPESLLYGITELHKKIMSSSLKGKLHMPRPKEIISEIKDFMP